MNNHLIKTRLRKAYFIGRIIAIFPYVRCVILNGSLTGKSHKESSDIDILIIAKNGHIYTARFFINFWSMLFGLKRSKNSEKSHAGKFCFNYFLTESFLRIPTGRGEKMDRYCADNYSQSMFIAGDIKLFKKYIKANNKLFTSYNCHPEPRLKRDKLREGSIMTDSSAKPQNDNILLFQKFSEFLFGNWFEKWAKKYQIKSIESDPRTKKYPTLIVINDKELRFHPPK